MQVNKEESQQIRDLPGDFIDSLSRVLGDEFDLFLDSMTSGERTYGLRINPLKCQRESISEALNMAGVSICADAAVPWTQEGFYYNKDSYPGRSPFHEAGMYYIQEPSAMAVAEALDISPGDRVCDLCAAPGGKSTHIAGKMMGNGLLVSNEFVYERAKILSRNIERMGVVNAIVTSEAPDRLAEVFPGFFNKVCVDAPCSGEGMFRKEPQAIDEWSMENVHRCAKRQLDILESAAMLTAGGGVMVYSTCTFEPSEDEEVIARFLKEHSEFRLEKSPITGFFSPGLEGYGLSGEQTKLVSRIWPHTAKGEGHFIARMRKAGEQRFDRDALYADFRKKKGDRRDELVRFLETELGIKEDSELISDIKSGRLYEIKNECYAIPPYISLNEIKKLRLLRIGLKIAEYDGKRYKPDHALAMSIKKSELHNICALSEREAYAYLRGESIDLSGHKEALKQGWTVTALNGYNLGWGKLVGNTLKNHYPKGLRRNLES